MTAVPEVSDIQIPVELELQPRARRMIERIHVGEGGHAWLLTGARGNGPLAAAEWLAKSILIPQSASSDERAAIARRIERRVHPDLIWTEGEGSMIRVAQIDRILEQSSRKPFEAEAQVVVIHDGAALNSDAANKLLKTLEEPAGALVFIIVVEHPDYVIPTIRSRAAEIAFPPLPPAVSAGYIAQLVQQEGMAPDPSAHAPEVLARVGRGDASRIHEIVAGGLAWERYRGVVEGCIELVSARLDPSALSGWILGRLDACAHDAEAAADAEFAKLMETMGKDEQARFKSKQNDEGLEKRTKRRVRRARRDELLAVLKDMEMLWRDLMVVASGGPGSLLLCADQAGHIQQLAGSHAAVRAVAGLDVISEAAARVRGSGDDKMAVESLLVELGALAQGRIRARRTLGVPAQTEQGYSVYLS
jgi:hypothetical protein